MIVALDRETLVSLLVNMPHSAGVIVSMISHGVCTTYPTHELAHLAIYQWT